MTTKELIRQKIDAYYTEYKAKFHQNGDSYYFGIIDGLDMAERILDTLPDESEQPTRGYDEAYLNEKIAKASKSWKGVDVNKFMDEVRGREPVTDCNDLTEAAENSWAVYEYRESPKGLYSTCYVDGFIAGAEWMKRKMNGDSLEGPTCKSCGFYENNCPFIRGKFMPYPSKVCKDFTFSVIKNEGEQ